MQSNVKKLNVLLITNSNSGAQAIEHQLSQGRNLWTVWRFSDLEDVAEFNTEQNVEADLIIFDLTEFSDDSRDPKSALLRLRKRFLKVPLLVIVDRTDHDLMHYAVRESSADSLSFWQIKGDCRNLLNLIDALLTRFELSQNLERKVVQASSDSDQKYEAFITLLNEAKLQFDSLQKSTSLDAEKYQHEIELLKERILKGDIEK